GTGSVTEGELPISSAVYARGSDGSIFLLEADGKTAFRLKPAKDGFLPEAVHLDANKTRLLLYGRCVAEMKSAVRAVALKEIADSGADLAGGRVVCKKFGDQILLTTFSHGSAGEIRSDRVISEDTNEDIRNTLSEHGGGLSKNNMTWVGLQLEPETFRLGALLNRNAMVYASGDVILNYRHQEAPTGARFAGPDRLLV